MLASLASSEDKPLTWPLKVGDSMVLMFHSPIEPPITHRVGLAVAHYWCEDHGRAEFYSQVSSFKEGFHAEL